METAQIDANEISQHPEIIKGNLSIFNYRLHVNKTYPKF